MLLGQLLFLLAAFSIVGATVIGVISGVSKIVVYKATGRKFAPEPEKGSAAWRETTANGMVDLARVSLLTEGPKRSTDDPIVVLEGERYRVIRLGQAKFLVSQVAEGRRVGTFELVGEGRFQSVDPTADDVSSEKLVRDVAQLAGLVQRADGRIAIGGHEDPRPGPSAHSH